MLQDYGSTYATGHGDPPPDAVPRAERRAGLRRRHGPVVVGPRRQPRPRSAPPPTRGCSRRRSTCSPTWASSRDTLQAGLIGGRRASTDTTAPTSTITSPADGATVAGRQPTSPITGTATDTGGGVVGGVEVSIDGGATWHPATGRASWTYTWTPDALRHRDDPSRAPSTTAATSRPPPAGVTVDRRLARPACPCSIWSRPRPRRPARDLDTAARRARRQVPLATSTATITGVRFYKGADQHRHPRRHLWTRTGTLLATATFTGETASGWQQVAFADAGRDHRRHHLRRLLLRAERPLRGQRRTTSPPAASTRAPLHALADDDRRRQRRLRLRRRAAASPPAPTAEQLLGRRRVQTTSGARHHAADRHRRRVSCRSAARSTARPG